MSLPPLPPQSSSNTQPPARPITTTSAASEVVFASESDVASMHDVLENPDAPLRHYIDLVLNCPPVESLVKFENVPGRKGEQRNIAFKNMQQIADLVFDGWETRNCVMHLAGGDKPRLVCTVEVHATYRCAGSPIRVMVGASDGSLAQTTAAEAVLASAIKNGLRKFGAIFGRELYSEKYFEQELINTTQKTASHGKGI